MVPQGEHAACGLVDTLLTDKIFLDQFFAMLKEAGAHHLDIDTGVQCEFCGFLGVSCGTMCDQLVHSGVVADHRPIETKPATQDICQQGLVTGQGNPIPGVESAHDKISPFIDAGLVEWQVRLVESHRTYFCVVVLASPIGCAVAYVVFDARQQASIMVAIHDSTDHGAGEENILPITFHDTSPARVTGQVAHRRECDINTSGRGLCGAELAGPPDQVGVEGSCLCKGDRQDEIKAMYHVEHE